MLKVWQEAGQHYFQAGPLFLALSIVSRDKPRPGLETGQSLHLEIE